MYLKEYIERKRATKSTHVLFYCQIIIVIIIIINFFAAVMIRERERDKEIPLLLARELI